MSFNPEAIIMPQLLSILNIRTQFSRFMIFNMLHQLLSVDVEWSLWIPKTWDISLSFGNGATLGVIGIIPVFYILI